MNADLSKVSPGARVVFLGGLLDGLTDWVHGHPTLGLPSGVVHPMAPGVLYEKTRFVSRRDGAIVYCTRSIFPLVLKSMNKGGAGHA